MTRILLAVLAALHVWASSATADGFQYDIELWLALDNSGTMFQSPHHGEISHEATIGRDVQVAVHVAALKDPLVRSLLLEYKTLVHVLVWAGAGSEYTLTPESGFPINSESDIDSLANIIATTMPHTTSVNSSTDHYAALQYIARMQVQGARIVVDISTDEVVASHSIATTHSAREEITKMGGTINVFGVNMSTDNVGLYKLEKDLATEDGFVEYAYADDVTAGFRRKVVRELTLAHSFLR